MKYLTLILTNGFSRPYIINNRWTGVFRVINKRGPKKLKVEKPVCSLDRPKKDALLNELPHKQFNEPRLRSLFETSCLFSKTNPVENSPQIKQLPNNASNDPSNSSKKTIWEKFIDATKSMYLVAEQNSKRIKSTFTANPLHWKHRYLVKKCKVNLYYFDKRYYFRKLQPKLEIFSQVCGGVPRPNKPQIPRHLYECHEDFKPTKNQEDSSDLISESCTLKFKTYVVKCRDCAAKHRDCAIKCRDCAAKSNCCSFVKPEDVVKTASCSLPKHVFEETGCDLQQCDIPAVKNTAYSRIRNQLKVVFRPKYRACKSANKIPRYIVKSRPLKPFCLKPVQEPSLLTCGGVCKCPEDPQASEEAKTSTTGNSSEAQNSNVCTFSPLLAKVDDPCQPDPSTLRARFPGDPCRPPPEICPEKPAKSCEKEFKTDMPEAKLEAKPESCAETKPEEPIGAKPCTIVGPVVAKYTDLKPEAQALGSISPTISGPLMIKCTDLKGNLSGCKALNPFNNQKKGELNKCEAQKSIKVEYQCKECGLVSFVCEAHPMPLKRPEPYIDPYVDPCGTFLKYPRDMFARSSSCYLSEKKEAQDGKNQPEVSKKFCDCRTPELVSMSMSEDGKDHKKSLCDDEDEKQKSYEQKPFPCGLPKACDDGCEQNIEKESKEDPKGKGPCSPRTISDRCKEKPALWEIDPKMSKNIDDVFGGDMYKMTSRPPQFIPLKHEGTYPRKKKRNTEKCRRDTMPCFPNVCPQAEEKCRKIQEQCYPDPCPDKVNFELDTLTCDLKNPEGCKSKPKSKPSGPYSRVCNLDASYSNPGDLSLTDADFFTGLESRTLLTETQRIQNLNNIKKRSFSVLSSKVLTGMKGYYLNKRLHQSSYQPRRHIYGTCRNDSSTKLRNNKVKHLSKRKLKRLQATMQALSACIDIACINTSKMLYPLPKDSESRINSDLISKEGGLMPRNNSNGYPIERLESMHYILKRIQPKVMEDQKDSSKGVGKSNLETYSPIVSTHSRTSSLPSPTEHPETEETESTERKVETKNVNANADYPETSPINEIGKDLEKAVSTVQSQQDLNKLSSIEQSETCAIKSPAQTSLKQDLKDYISTEQSVKSVKASVKAAMEISPKKDFKDLTAIKQILPKPDLKEVTNPTQSKPFAIKSASQISPKQDLKDVTLSEPLKPSAVKSTAQISPKQDLKEVTSPEQSSAANPVETVLPKIPDPNLSKSLKVDATAQDQAFKSVKAAATESQKFEPKKLEVVVEAAAEPNPEPKKSISLKFDVAVQDPNHREIESVKAPLLSQNNLIGNPTKLSFQIDVPLQKENEPRASAYDASYAAADSIDSVEQECLGCMVYKIRNELSDGEFSVAIDTIQKQFDEKFVLSEADFALITGSSAPINLLNKGTPFQSQKRTYCTNSKTSTIYQRYLDYRRAKAMKDLKSETCDLSNKDDGKSEGKIPKVNEARTGKVNEISAKVEAPVPVTPAPPLDPAKSVKKVSSPLFPPCPNSPQKKSFFLKFSKTNKDKTKAHKGAKDHCDQKDAAQKAAASKDHCDPKHVAQKEALATKQSAASEPQNKGEGAKTASKLPRCAGAKPSSKTSSINSTNQISTPMNSPKLPPPATKVNSSLDNSKRSTQATTTHPSRIQTPQELGDTSNLNSSEDPTPKYNPETSQSTIRLYPPATAQHTNKNPRPDERISASETAPSSKQTPIPALTELSHELSSPADSELTKVTSTKASGELTKAPPSTPITDITKTPTTPTIGLAKTPSTPTVTEPVKPPSTPIGTELAKVLTTLTGTELAQVSTTPTGTELAQVSTTLTGTELAQVSTTPTGTELANVSTTPTGTELAKVSTTPTGTELAKVSTTPTGTELAKVSTTPTGTKLAQVSTTPGTEIKISVNPTNVEVKLASVEPTQTSNPATLKPTQASSTPGTARLIRVSPPARAETPKLSSTPVLDLKNDSIPAPADTTNGTVSSQTVNSENLSNQKSVTNQVASGPTAGASSGSKPSSSPSSGGNKDAPPPSGESGSKAAGDSKKPAYKLTIAEHPPLEVCCPDGMVKVKSKEPPCKGRKIPPGIAKAAKSKPKVKKPKAASKRHEEECEDDKAGKHSKPPTVLAKKGSSKVGKPSPKDSEKPPPLTHKQSLIGKRKADFLPKVIDKEKCEKPPTLAKCDPLKKSAKKVATKGQKGKKEAVVSGKKSKDPCPRSKKRPPMISKAIKGGKQKVCLEHSEKADKESLDKKSKTAAKSVKSKEKPKPKLTPKKAACPKNRVESEKVCGPVTSTGSTTKDKPDKKSKPKSKLPSLKDKKPPDCQKKDATPPKTEPPKLAGKESSTAAGKSSPPPAKTEKPADTPKMAVNKSFLDLRQSHHPKPPIKAQSEPHKESDATDGGYPHAVDQPLKKSGKIRNFSIEAPKFAPSKPDDKGGKDDPKQKILLGKAPSKKPDDKEQIGRIYKVKVVPPGGKDDTSIAGRIYKVKIGVPPPETEVPDSKTPVGAVSHDVPGAKTPVAAVSPQKKDVPGSKTPVGAVPLPKKDVPGSKIPGGAVSPPKKDLPDCKIPVGTCNLEQYQKACSDLKVKIEKQSKDLNTVIAGAEKDITNLCKSLTNSAVLTKKLEDVMTFGTKQISEIEAGVQKGKTFATHLEQTSRSFEVDQKKLDGVIIQQKDTLAKLGEKAKQTQIENVNMETNLKEAVEVGKNLQDKVKEGITGQKVLLDILATGNKVAETTKASIRKGAEINKSIEEQIIKTASLKSSWDTTFSAGDKAIKGLQDHVKVVEAKSGQLKNSVSAAGGPMLELQKLLKESDTNKDKIIRVVEAVAKTVHTLESAILSGETENKRMESLIQKTKESAESVVASLKSLDTAKAKSDAGLKCLEDQQKGLESSLTLNTKAKERLTVLGINITDLIKESEKLIKISEVGATALTDVLRQGQEIEMDIKNAINCGKTETVKVVEALNALKVSLTNIEHTQKSCEEESKKASKIINCVKKMMDEFEKQIKTGNESNTKLTDLIKKVEGAGIQLEFTIKSGDEKRALLVTASKNGNETLNAVGQAIKLACDSKAKILLEIKSAQKAMDDLKRVISRVGSECQIFNDAIKAGELSKRELELTVKKIEDGKKQVDDALKASQKVTQELSKVTEDSTKAIQHLGDMIKKSDSDSKDLENGIKISQQEAIKINHIIKHVCQVQAHLEEVAKTGDETSTKMKNVTKTALEKIRVLEGSIKQSDVERKKVDELSKSVKDLIGGINKTLADSKKEADKLSEMSKLTTKATKEVESLFAISKQVCEKLNAAMNKVKTACTDLEGMLKVSDVEKGKTLEVLKRVCAMQAEIQDMIKHAVEEKVKLNTVLHAAKGTTKDIEIVVKNHNFEISRTKEKLKLLSDSSTNIDNLIKANETEANRINDILKTTKASTGKLEDAHKLSNTEIEQIKTAVNRGKEMGDKLTATITLGDDMCNNLNKIVDKGIQEMKKLGDCIKEMMDQSKFITEKSAELAKQNAHMKTSSTTQRDHSVNISVATKQTEKSYCDKLLENQEPKTAELAKQTAQMKASSTKQRDHSVNISVEKNQTEKSYCDKLLEDKEPNKAKEGVGDPFKSKTSNLDLGPEKDKLELSAFDISDKTDRYNVSFFDPQSNKHEIMILMTQDKMHEMHYVLSRKFDAHNPNIPLMWSIERILRSTENTTSNKKFSPQKSNAKNSKKPSLVIPLLTIREEYEPPPQTQNLAERLKNAFDSLAIKLEELKFSTDNMNKDKGVDDVIETKGFKESKTNADTPKYKRFDFDRTVNNYYNNKKHVAKVEKMKKDAMNLYEVLLKEESERLAQQGRQKSAIQNLPAIRNVPVNPNIEQKIQPSNPNALSTLLKTFLFYFARAFLQSLHYFKDTTYVSFKKFTIKNNQINAHKHPAQSPTPHDPPTPNDSPNQQAVFRKNSDSKSQDGSRREFCTMGDSDGAKDDLKIVKNNPNKSNESPHLESKTSNLGYVPGDGKDAELELDPKKIVRRQCPPIKCGRKKVEKKKETKQDKKPHVSG